MVTVPVECEWKEGRPYASRPDVAKLLKLPLEGDPTIDLIEALNHGGWLLCYDRDGSIQIIDPNSAATTGTGTKSSFATPTPTPTLSATPVVHADLTKVFTDPILHYTIHYPAYLDQHSTKDGEVVQLGSLKLFVNISLKVGPEGTYSPKAEAMKKTNQRADMVTSRKAVIQRTRSGARMLFSRDKAGFYRAVLLHLSIGHQKVHWTWLRDAGSEPL
jgi:hypothetical protein